MKIVRAQLLHNFFAKNGARAQFLHNFSERPGTQAGSVLRTISTQFSQPGAILSKSAAVQDRDVSRLGEGCKRSSEGLSSRGSEKLWFARLAATFTRLSMYRVPSTFA